MRRASEKQQSKKKMNCRISCYVPSLLTPRFTRTTKIRDIQCRIFFEEILQNDMFYEVDPTPEQMGPIQ